MCFEIHRIKFFHCVLVVFCRILHFRRPSSATLWPTPFPGGKHQRFWARQCRQEDWESAKKETALKKSAQSCRNRTANVVRRGSRQPHPTPARRTDAAGQSRDKNVKPFKSRAQVEKEQDSKKPMGLVERNVKLNQKRMELQNGKYAAQARIMRHSFVALHSPEPAAGIFQAQVQRQTHFVQRNFLLREEKIASLEAEVKTLEK
jgi:hypothetical protein